MTSSRGRRPEEDYFLSCRCLGGQWLLCDETERQDCCSFLSEYRAHPRLVHISWPCSVAKSVGSICLHQKGQRAAEKNFVARLQRSFTYPTTISRVRRSVVERRPRVIKDKTPKNTTWLVLDHHPLYRTDRVSRARGKMFQHPLEALLDHAGSDTEPPVIRISSRNAMPHVVTSFQRSTRIL